MDMREENDGYQHIYLYRDLESTNPLNQIKYEYGGIGADKTYRRVTFNFSSLYLSDFVYENRLSLVVRYNASGAFADDWYNKNVVTDVTVSKKILRSTNTVEAPV